jgi:hypothetical protein
MREDRMVDHGISVIPLKKNPLEASMKTFSLAYCRYKVTEWLFLLLFALQVMGCAGIGPHTVARDRFDYVSAISESWKKQTLLNLVKIRYSDAPVYVDIASVINTYEMQGTVSLGANWANAPLTDTQNLSASGRYTDRPTITYTPLAGERFTRALMTPIPVTGILFLLQAGYPADYIFRICVQTINGLNNSYGANMSGRDMDPGFHELISLFRDLQKQGGLGMRVKPQGNDQQEAIVMFFRPMIDEAFAKKAARVRELLGIDPNHQEIRVVYGSFAGNDQEIAILSRSMLQIQVDYSSYINVPQKHVDTGEVMDLHYTERLKAQGLPPLVQIHSGSSKPNSPHVAVQYLDHWYWIERSDFNSKSLFTFLMLMFSLTEEGGGQGAPIVTVPTN